MTWRPSRAALATASAACVLLSLGLVTGRPDVAVLGLPLAATVTIGWVRRPDAGSRLIRGHPRQSQDEGTVQTDVTVEAIGGGASVQVRIQAPGHLPGEVLVAAEHPRTIVGSMRTVRTGRFELFAIDHIAFGADAVVREAPGRIPAASVALVPRIRPLRDLPLPFRLQGMTGGHDSRRIGEGGDLRDIGPFHAGDRLRRIDWRVTARRMAEAGPRADRVGDLYVRRTMSTADASVVLVIDSRDELGPNVAQWGDSMPTRQDEATSLDVAREAAASIARRYLDTGDRVGIDDLARTSTPVRPAGGRRQLDRLMQRIVLAAPETRQASLRVRPPHVPSGAIVVLCSTFLDEQAAEVAMAWRHAGHRVIAVDVMPHLTLDDLDVSERLAYAIIALERTERLLALTRSSIDVVSWEGVGVAQVSPAVALSARSRVRQRR